DTFSGRVGCPGRPPTRLRLRMPRDRAGPAGAAAQGAGRRQAYPAAVDDEQRSGAAPAGPALRVGGGGGPFATSLLLGRAPALASSSFLATGPPAPPGTTRSVVWPCGILKRSLGPVPGSTGASSSRARAGSGV